MKTARFATIVAKCGRPTLHLAWQPLAKDAALKSALAANRVMTIHRALRGPHTDFGTVGFVKEPNTQVLIFPRSLRRFAGQRVVGINYDLLADAAPLQPAKAGAPDANPRSRPSRPANAIKLLPLPPSAPTAVAQSRREKSAASSPVEEFPLTWGAAARELDQVRRQLNGRPEIAARLARLSARMKAKLAPH